MKMNKGAEVLINVTAAFLTGIATAAAGHLMVEEGLHKDSKVQNAIYIYDAEMFLGGALIGWRIGRNRTANIRHRRQAAELADAREQIVAAHYAQIASIQRTAYPDTTFTPND